MLWSLPFSPLLLYGRRRSYDMSGWFSLVSNNVSESFVYLDLQFAFRRLADHGVLNLAKDGHRYTAEASDVRWFFGNGYFMAEITPEGWKCWESLNA